MTASSYSVGLVFPAHMLYAHNDAAASANKIHDDTVAKQYGFRGGLVPGVSVYAYMTYPLVANFGQDWLSRGTAQVRFTKPIYDGDHVTVTGTVTTVGEKAIGCDIAGVNAEGVECAVGSATLPAEPLASPALTEAPVGPLTASRVPISWEAVVLKQPLPTLTLTIDQAANEVYCAEHSDDLALYQGPQGFVHPGLLLRQCNRVFSEHFILGPWIHVASDITTYRACHVGERLEVRAIAREKFSKNGHDFVALDVLLVAEGMVAQRVIHTCIFRPRQQRA